MADFTTLSKTNRIQIPLSVRKSQGWKPGQKIAFVPHGKLVQLVAVPTLDELCGMAEGADTTGYRDRSE
jgi:bifunctional DNA-binding transcriptional regulator/antitoxin component of YhaV-PrlF toxin-antitoxin module